MCFELNDEDLQKMVIVSVFFSIDHPGGCRPPRHSTLSTLSTHRHMITMTMVSKMVMMRLMVMKFLKTMIVMMMTMLAR